jgi:hypothetical protein
MNRLIAVPTLLIMLVSACGDDGGPGTQQDATAARTTPAGTSSTAQVEADMAEVSDYRLSMDAVESVHQAQRSVYRQAASNPELVRHLQVDLGDATLDDLERHYGSRPELRRAIEDAGLEVREFVLVVFSLFQAMAAQQMIASGMNQDTVMAQMEVHPDNVRFARENQARLEQMQRETDALEPEGLGDGDDYDY